MRNPVYKYKLTYRLQILAFKNIFFRHACAYNKSMQQEAFIEGLKEEDAYPADPEDMDGRNYCDECVDILWKIMELR